MKRKDIYLSILILSILISAIGVAILYYYLFSHIIETLETVEGTWYILYIIMVRMVVLSVLSIYMFRVWFRQEKQYITDIPFLFALFFLILIYGKSLDILVNFTYFNLPKEQFFTLLKLRHFVVILNMLPLVFFSLEMILFALSLKEKYQKLSDESYRDKIRMLIIIIICVTESAVIILNRDITFTSVYVSLFVFPILIIIIWVFYFAHRNKRLSQINAKILIFGFGLYLISQFLRPMLHIQLGEIAYFIIIAEITDLIAFVIIFIGLRKKANY